MKPKHLILALVIIFSLAVPYTFASLRIIETSLGNNYEPNSVEFSQEVLGPMSLMSPEITKENKRKAIQKIKEQDGVIEAVILQNDAKVKLVLTVIEATTKEQGKELGERFVRLIKTFCRDPNPNKEIGKGIYDYIVEVYYPEKKELVIGIKDRLNEFIAWEAA